MSFISINLADALFCVTWSCIVMEGIMEAQEIFKA